MMLSMHPISDNVTVGIYQVVVAAIEIHSWEFFRANIEI